MDPLSLIVQELRRAEEEAAKYEIYLSRFEARSDFDACDEVYRRIADEKQIVLRSAADLRSKLTDQAVSVIASQGQAIYRVESDGQSSYFLDRIDATFLTSSPSSIPHHGMVALSHNDLDLSVIACAEDTGPQFPHARADAPDLLKYRADKAELSAIMRDFTNNKIHFVGIDDHTIVMAEYQTFRKAIKTGKDPALFMKGEYRTYRTGYIKATNIYTENKLFFPYTIPASY
eukprot:gene12214-14146_t